MDISNREMFVEVYTSPEKVKEMMPEEARKDYANFKVSEEKIKEYQENFHWGLKPIDSELTESDKLMLFLSIL